MPEGSLQESVECCGSSTFDLYPLLGTSTLLFVLGPAHYQAVSTFPFPSTIAVGHLSNSCRVSGYAFFSSCLLPTSLNPCDRPSSSLFGVLPFYRPTFADLGFGAVFRVCHRVRSAVRISAYTATCSSTRSVLHSRVLAERRSSTILCYSKTA